VLREVKGIADCFVLKENPKNIEHDGKIVSFVSLSTPHNTTDAKIMQLMTNGSNFPGMWSLIAERECTSSLKTDNILTNDIHAMLTHYGVEAARTVLIREISSVFGAYNIDVDGRHLELVADYMVRPLSSLAVVVLTVKPRRMMAATSPSRDEEFPPTPVRCSRPRTRPPRRSYVTLRCLGIMTDWTRLVRAL
jgi:hypothetical protein